jgi:membrane protease YdiL (CAAX protease family)
MDFNPPSEPLRDRWGAADLIAFGSFFFLSLLFLPLALVDIARIFQPGISPAHLSGIATILVQAALDFAWIGFIFFLIRIIHRQPILESIHWFRNPQFPASRLIALGAVMALGVLAVSSFFPPSSKPPIEELVESPGSLYPLVIFGIFFAPIIEEILFRGFLFNVFEDLGGSRLAVVSTALLFAIMHAPQLKGSWAGVLLILVVGFVLSLIRERSNSLIPSFTIHTAYNGTLFGVSALSALLQHGK